jgi:hypothetical protein
MLMAAAAASIISRPKNLQLFSDQEQHILSLTPPLLISNHGH